MKEDQLVVWWGTEIECIAALARKEREGRLTSIQISCAKKELKKILYDAIEVSPSQEIKNVSERLLRIHPLRSADSLQLARIFHGDSSRGAAQRDADKADEDLSAELYSTYRSSSNRSPTQSASGFRKPQQIHREICGLAAALIFSGENISEMTMVTLDKQLGSCAEREGLRVIL